MRKATVFAVTMLLIVSLMSLMPVVKAAVCYWDDVRFVYDHEGGNWIKYPHPDRDYYDIDPYTTQGIDGNLLHHLQIDAAKSIVIVAAADLVCACIGARIGGVAGALVGAALGIVVTYVAETCFLDESNCIWVWISRAFMDWISENQWSLFMKSLTDWAGAFSLVLAYLIGGGYLRIGTIAFIDSLDIGSGGLGGGEILPTDKLSLIAPQIALSLMVCVGFVVMRRKFGKTN